MTGSNIQTSEGTTRRFGYLSKISSGHGMMRNSSVNPNSVEDLLNDDSLNQDASKLQSLNYFNANNISEIGNDTKQFKNMKNFGVNSSGQINLGVATPLFYPNNMQEI